MFTQSLLIRILLYIDYVTKTLSVSAWALACLTVWVFFHISPVNKTKTISTLRALLILVVLIAFKASTNLIFYIFFWIIYSSYYSNYLFVWLPARKAWCFPLLNLIHCACLLAFTNHNYQENKSYFNPCISILHVSIHG